MEKGRRYTLIGLLLLGLSAILLRPVFLRFDADSESYSPEQLQSELSALKREVRALKQMQFEFSSMEREMTQIRARLRAPEVALENLSNESEENLPEETDSRPLFEVKWRPDGTHRDDPFLGAKDSPVVVMGFFDYQCGPCRSFARETFPLLKEGYTDSRKLRFILRDYPLDSNVQARHAAELAHCAGEQGLYWRAFDALLQGTEEDATRELKKELPSAVENLPGLDVARMRKCLNAKRYQREIEADIKEARSLGAKGAPGFFIGRVAENGEYQGVFLRGAQPWPVIRAQINKHL